MHNEQVRRLHARKMRRREICKINQRRYRKRLKIQEDIVKNEMVIVSENLSWWKQYNDLILQGSLLRPLNARLLQVTLVHTYADLFANGRVQYSSSSTRARQLQYLKINVHPKCILQSGTVVPSGPDEVANQWERYTLLHPRLKLTKLHVEVVHAEARVIKLYCTIVLPLQVRTIAALYPHMMSSGHFLGNVVGKSLEYTRTTTFVFNALNQVVSYSNEHTLVNGWERILENMILTTYVVTNVNMTEHCILCTDEEITKAFEAETCVKLVKKERMEKKVKEVVKDVITAHNFKIVPKGTQKQISRFAVPPKKCIELEVLEEMVKKQGNMPFLQDVLHFNRSPTMMHSSRSMEEGPTLHPYLPPLVYEKNSVYETDALPKGFLDMKSPYSPLAHGKMSISLDFQQQSSPRSALPSIKEETREQKYRPQKPDHVCFADTDHYAPLSPAVFPGYSPHSSSLLLSSLSSLSRPMISAETCLGIGKFAPAVNTTTVTLPSLKNRMDFLMKNGGL